MVPDAEPSSTVPASMSDGELAAHIGRHPDLDVAGAEAELYRRFFPRVRLYGRRHLGGDDAARDLAQRVLLITLEKLRAGQVREPERIASFVLGTARMVRRAVQRGAGREQPLDDEAGPAALATADPMARERVAASLRGLPAREQSVLALTYFAGHDTDEIARALGLSAGNVRVIRHRAVARLRQALGLDESGAPP